MVGSKSFCLQLWWEIPPCAVLNNPSKVSGIRRIEGVREEDDVRACTLEKVKGTRMLFPIEIERDVIAGGMQSSVPSLQGNDIICEGLLLNDGSSSCVGLGMDAISLLPKVGLSDEGCLGPVAICGLVLDNSESSSLEDLEMVEEEGLTTQMEGLVEVPHEPCSSREKEVGIVRPEIEEGTLWPSILSAQGDDPTRVGFGFEPIGKSPPLPTFISRAHLEPWGTYANIDGCKERNSCSTMMMVRECEGVPTIDVAKESSTTR